MTACLSFIEPLTTEQIRHVFKLYVVDVGIWTHAVQVTVWLVTTFALAIVANLKEAASHVPIVMPVSCLVGIFTISGVGCAGSLDCSPCAIGNYASSQGDYPTCADVWSIMVCVSVLSLIQRVSLSNILNWLKVELKILFHLFVCWSCITITTANEHDQCFIKILHGEIFVVKWGLIGLNVVVSSVQGPSSARCALLDILLRIKVIGLTQWLLGIVHVHRF